MAIGKAKSQNSDGYFRSLVDGLTEHAIFGLDRNGMVVNWNIGAERLSGYRPDEIIGRHFSCLYTPEDVSRGLPEEDLKKAFAYGKWKKEEWRIRKNGLGFWASVTIGKLVDESGECIGYAEVIRDLTERKNAEDRLRESEERYHLMVNSVKDYAIFMLHPDGRVASWNQGAKRIKQYSAIEIIGQHFSKFYPPEEADQKKPEKELRVALTEGQFKREGWKMRKDGTAFWANTAVTPVFGQNGKLLGFSNVTRDLTERKCAEDTLEQRVKRRTEDLRRLASRLEAAVKVRDNFLSIASHELKTPITSLKLQVDLRKRHLRKEGIAFFTGEKLEKIITDDEKQILRLTNLIDEMLDSTRISSGKLMVKPERVDLNQLVREVIGRFHPEVQVAGYEISFEACSVVEGQWDPFRLEQVLINLLSNAVKYGAKKPIRVRLWADGAVAKLSVQDQGIGVHPMDQERIFRRFERAISESEVSGLGLGLFIALQIVRAHAGRIDLESKVGEGSTFTVSLPLRLA